METLEIKTKLTNFHGRSFIVGSDGTINQCAFIDTIGRKIKERTVIPSDHKLGYKQFVVRGECGKQKHIYAHRLIAKAFLSDYSDLLEVDHINGIKSDNRIENIRMANRTENLTAFRNKSFGKTSKYRGVYFCKTQKKWFSRIGHNYKSYYLGTFENELDAAKAYNKKANELMFDEAAMNLIGATNG